MRLLLVVILHSIHALSMKSFGNSTLRFSNTAANATSTVMTKYISPDDCKVLNDAWESSLDAFYDSKSSAEAAGRYSTITLSTYATTFTSFGYSSVAYIPKNKTSVIMIISFPTASRISIWTETITSILAPSYEQMLPNCEEPPTPCNSTECTIIAEMVQLFYWPVNAVSDYSNLTLTLNTTGPVTAVVNETTFTSPTIYLSYDQVSAINGCNQPVGELHPGAILNLNPSALSSIDLPHDPATGFNLADLNKPYSPNVLMQMCFPHPPEVCEVGINDIYNPKLVVPQEIRLLDPAWKDCNPDWFGSYDPPQILVPAHVLVQPSLTADIVEASSSAATPAHTVKPQRAASTTKLDAEVATLTSLTSLTKSRSGNEIPAKPTSSKVTSAITLLNKIPPAEGSPSPKTSVGLTPVASSSANEVPSKNLPSPNQDPPTKVISALESPRGKLSAIDTTIVSLPVQTSPATDTPAEKPSAEHSAAWNLPTRTETVQGSPIRDSQVPTRPFSVDSLPSKDPTVVLPFITVKSQVFATDAASDYDVDPQTLGSDC